MKRPRVPRQSEFKFPQDEKEKEKGRQAAVDAVRGTSSKDKGKTKKKTAKKAATKKKTAGISRSKKKTVGKKTGKK